MQSMMRMRLAVSALVVLFVSCNLPDDGPLLSTQTTSEGLTAAEVAQLHELSPLDAVPPDPTNAFADSAAAAVLGQRLFFDEKFSGPIVAAADGTNGALGAAGESGKVACASCHSSPATDDDRSVPNTVSLGTDYGSRNALRVLNSSFYKWSNWGGRFDAQWTLALAVAENPRVMNGSRLAIAHRLFDAYRADYDAIFPVPLEPALGAGAPDAARFPAKGKPKAEATDPDGAWEAMAAADRLIVNRVLANYGKAIAAYIRLLVSRDAPFDRYVAGDAKAMNESAVRGLQVFLRRGCVSCHSGPNFSDDQFHDIGIAQTGAHVPPTDTGRFGDIPPLLASDFNTAGAFSDDTSTGRLVGLAAQPKDVAAFRTPGLRSVSTSAPYMHAGQLATLEDVVAHYSNGGADQTAAGTKDSRIVPLQLTPLEQADLVSFLKALEGAPPPSALRIDTSR